MNLRETFDALVARVPRGMMLGLDRVERALAAVGDPHLGLAAVHVAGSNGKGSTSAMVDSIARAAGLHVGLYTSPHLCRFAERIRLGGEPIDDAGFARCLGEVMERCEPNLTFFESLTVAAFIAFRDVRVDLAVLEVGLGGRLDATNVIRAPIATAITSISLEHTAMLGDTLGAIAREKAGILKPGAPLVIPSLPREADEAIREVARDVGAGPIIDVRPDAGAIVGLAGAHQLSNAAVAEGVARLVAARFPERDVEGAIPRGLKTVRWPGRLQRIERGGVTVLLDGAHNPEGIDALVGAVASPPARTALVFGALADKRWADMVRAVAPLASRRYYTRPKGRRAAPPEELTTVAPGAAIDEPREALDRALQESTPGDTVIVAGSLYLVGELYAALLGIEADPIIAL